MKKRVVEIAVEVTDNQLKHIQAHLRLLKIPFYVEPPNLFYNLDELEASCLGE